MKTVLWRGKRRTQGQKALTRGLSHASAFDLHMTCRKPEYS